MHAVYLKLNSVADIEESIGTVSPMKGHLSSHVRPLWRISDLACMENVTDHVRFVEANIYCPK
jgi:hypothetical protein